MDPETGVALVIGTQLVSTWDPELLKVWGDVEKAFYTGISSV